MNPSEPLPDPIEQFLEGTPRATADPAFRQRLLCETIASLRRQRWRKRTAVIAALAASFLAGVVCMHWLPLATSEATREHASGSAYLREKPVPDTTRPADKDASASGRDAVAMEWTAFDDPGQREKLYRQAGDLYVEETQDYEAALRCYTQALDGSAEQDLTIAPDDTWLMMALKEARKKEHSHGKKSG
jgi:hypothetical protein